ncbi:MAG: serine/threonine protein kinase [Verrucomicrobia bacterium]|nr:serine/threonine protein kinase [Verrucomicrobiota bacterium]
MHRIGRGGYGEVWLARNLIGTQHAVKVVHRKRFDRERPYQREFEGIQNFEPISSSHEGFVRILQVGRNETEGYFYYVMELADDATAVQSAKSKVQSARSDRSSSRERGQRPSKLEPAISNNPSYVPLTLERELGQRGRLPLGECLDLGLSMTAALAKLHARGLVHRDVKPSNIIFVEGVPKLADIGTVAEMREATTLVGTEGFIPREGSKSSAADLYSLGKVLYEMSTGLDRKQFPKLPPDLKDHPDPVSFSMLNEILLRACALDPQQRYWKAEEMHADLAQVKQHQTIRHQQRLARRRVIARRFVLAVLLMGAAIAALVLVRRFVGR